jgi:hypothetical protein
MEKLRDYLLDREHPVGGPKASLLARFGYSSDDWQRLERDFREQHLTRDAVEQPASEYGRLFLIRGAITGPNGRSVILSSVWMIRHGEDIPRFITAFPGEEE